MPNQTGHVDRTHRDEIQSLSREALECLQLEKLNTLLSEILPTNLFYQKKFGDLTALESLDQLKQLPFTNKSELLSEDTFARNLTWPIQQYVRFHRTSGTQGKPMAVLDTADDWVWWMNVWQYVLDTADVTPDDRAFLAFSFGPFIGFWSAHDAILARGAMSIPGGGLSTHARLDLINASQPTVLLCTPTYALHLAEVAAENQIDLRASAVTRIIVAGEPGGSIPSIRDKIENAWDAKLIDHAGASEIGPWGFADARQTGLHVCEAEFIAEVIDSDSGNTIEAGGSGELVLTCLGRPGSPLIRYRTGDQVVPAYIDSSNFLLLEGGVLGRVDDMIVIRGVNVFPSALEEILRGFDEVVEYRITAFKDGEMDGLTIEVEDRGENTDRIKEAIEVGLGLRVQVILAESNSLPRFEAKGRRFIDNR
ncbi:MAG: CoF synthetase [Planctomycetaceae bacterium]|nr:CoF synthetase [Planctomycetaceae bacterium]|tara:strand:- start:2279 stop:3547 length:1269 start_codon:yes stop_codon:yes gene_type:complete